MSDRIGAVDFSKGMLVLFMVVYHSLNCLGHESLPHYYLLFVPPSFILITGFIVTHVYVPRYGTATREIVSRLTLRSVKLVTLFTLMNVGAGLVFSGRRGGAVTGLSDFVGNWVDVYVMGGSRWAAFEVLLPIGYLLCLSIPVLWLQARVPAATAWVTAAVIAACLAAERFGYPVYNLYLIGAGLLGMAVGLVPDAGMKAAIGRWGPPLAFYALYWLAFLLLGDRYGVQLVATLASVALVYTAGSRIDLHRWMPVQVLILGRYSLLAYIVQIFYLQLFKRSPLYGDFGATGAVAVILLAAVLTWATVRVLDRVRGDHALVDRAYRLIFA